jgi:hypothetical protein
MNLRRRWTEEEDQMLRELALKISSSRIAVRLKRTRTGVLSRANYLKVQLAANRDEISSQDGAARLGSEHRSDETIMCLGSRSKPSSQ